MGLSNIDNTKKWDILEEAPDGQFVEVMRNKYTGDPTGYNVFDGKRRFYRSCYTQFKAIKYLQQIIQIDHERKRKALDNNKG